MADGLANVAMDDLASVQDVWPSSNHLLDGVEDMLQNDLESSLDARGGRRIARRNCTAGLRAPLRTHLDGGRQQLTRLRRRVLLCP